MKVQRPVRTLVENRTVFEAHNAELSIYDTYESVNNVGLDSEQLLYCGMIAGTKHLHNAEGFRAPFLPHESFILAPNETVYIDFPDASMERPTTCIAIGITRDQLIRTCYHLNQSAAIPQDIEDWQVVSPRWLLTPHSVATQNLLIRIVSSFLGKDHDRDLVLNLGVTELLLRMTRRCGTDFLKKAAKKDPTRTALSAVLHLIETRLASNISIDDLCKVACMSRTKLYQQFRAFADCSPMEYVQRERVRHASQLLVQGYSSTQACYSVGFSSPSHFCRRFTNHYGVTPRVFAQQRRSLHRVQPHDPPKMNAHDILVNADTSRT
ncbi:MAG: AraC family transcriptional regulator [Myxococcales bacterium]|nr:AraC family transcriptional regulator [Myxococcales bacterium]